MQDPIFFKSADRFREWLEQNGRIETELWVGFYKGKHKRGELEYKGAVDEGLCFGWIDGIVKSHDEQSFKHRFTPRKAKSTWSLVNIKRFNELKELGRVAPSGQEAFDRRTEDRSGIYAFEQNLVEFTPEMEAEFQKNLSAWSFFQAQPPGYRRVATWRVISAKQEATRERRLLKLIEWSALGKRLEDFQ